MAGVARAGTERQKAHAGPSWILARSMPPARPARRLARRTLVVLALALLAAGAASGAARPAGTAADGGGIPAHDAAEVPAHVDSAAVVLQSASTGTTADDGRDNATLLTRDELFDSVVDADPGDARAALYLVAEDGSWYHADPNGTVGAVAPDGSDLPNVADETVDVPASERPVYVWKVTVGGCGTTAYDAGDGAVVAAYPIPGCPLRTPPSEPRPTTDRSPREEPLGGSTASPTTGASAGFGVGVAVAAVLATARLLVRG